jgi:hypothetical protein
MVLRLMRRRISTHTMRADHARPWLTKGQRQVHLPALGLPFASTYECRTAVGSAALKTKRTQGLSGFQRFSLFRPDLVLALVR